MAGQELALRVFLSVVGVLGLGGNGLVALVIARVRFMHTLTNAFILNQAVIDLLGSAALLSSRLVIPLPEPVPPGVAGALLCHLWASNVFVFQLFFTSTFNLVALTLERYLAIVFPFRYQALATRRSACLVLAAVWVSAFLFNSFGFFIQRYEAGRCLQTPVASPAVLGSFILGLTYAVPVGVMLTVHGHIALVLKRGARVAGLAPGVRGAPAPSAAGDAPVGAEGQGESLLRARRNTFRTLLIVSAAFVLCWTPNEILFFLFNLGKGVDLSSAVYAASVGLAASNCCLNPFIYAFKYRQFRKAMKTLCGRENAGSSDISTVSTRH